MRTYTTSCQGIQMTLNNKDNLKLRSEGRIESNCEDNLTTKVLLILKKNVKNRPKHMEERGFRIQVYPISSSKLAAKRIEVQISKERYREAQKTGCIVTRCRYDRFSLNYYSPDQKIYDIRPER